MKKLGYTDTETQMQESDITSLVKNWGTYLCRWADRQQDNIISLLLLSQYKKNRPKSDNVQRSLTSRF
jgi:hypothetical protein